MRSSAFRDADLIIVLGTRMNYIIGHASPPRFGPNATIARIDIDSAEIAMAARYVDIPIVGDCKAVLGQLLERIKGKVSPDRFKGWRQKLQDGEQQKRNAAGANKYAEDGDIHPVRMLEAVRDFANRDAILCVDGQETLNFGRQTMPTFSPGHRLNSGPFGTMGVGLPFGVGAKVACPDKQVIVVHGDGSMGMNAMEMDTAIRHKIPLLRRNMAATNRHMPDATGTCRIQTGTCQIQPFSRGFFGALFVRARVCTLIVPPCVCSEHGTKSTYCLLNLGLFAIVHFIDWLFVQAINQQHSAVAAVFEDTEVKRPHESRFEIGACLLHNMSICFLLLLFCCSPSTSQMIRDIHLQGIKKRFVFPSSLQPCLVVSRFSSFVCLQVLQGHILQ